jgi:hypothetical protein
MTVREIQAHLEEIYQVEVSPSLISTVTDGVIDEVRAWQNRPLDRLYPIIYLDSIMVKIRDGAHILKKAIYLVIGVKLEGSGFRPATDLQFGHPRAGRRQVGRIRSEVGLSISDDKPGLAAQLGEDSPFLSLPARDPKSDLHNQRDRVSKQRAEKDHKESRVVPQRRVGIEAAVPGTGQHQPEVDQAYKGMEGSAKSVCDSL